MDNTLLEKFITEFSHQDARPVIKDLFKGISENPELTLTAMFHSFFEKMAHDTIAERNALFSGFVMGISLVQIITENPDLHKILTEILSKKSAESENSNLIYLANFTKGEIH